MKALLLALLVVLVPAKPRAPLLKYLGNGDYLAVNPTDKPVRMRVECSGSDAWEVVNLQVGPDGPQGRLEVRIVEPNGDPAICHMMKWETVGSYKP